LVPLTAQAKAHKTPLGIAFRAAGSPAGSAASGSYGLTPQDLHAAYNLPASTLVSPGQTIGIVDAYNNPDLEADLAVYDREFSLPPCTAANGCLRVVNENGLGTPLPEANSGWATEIALDVEIAHAICEDCHILLVEAANEGEVALEAAVRTARRLGATVISNSWGMEEPTSAQTAATFNMPGVAVVAAAGDFGYRNWWLGNAAEEYVFYPAASPDVLAVGGTRLELGGEGKYLGERIWNGQGATGGGCAERSFFAAPRWQVELPDWSEVGCELRAVSDISADGDPWTGAAVYNSFGERGGWETVGGTSLAAPLVAAAIALAGGVPEGTSYIAETIYANALRNPQLIHPVKEGSNGRCTKPYTATGLSGCTALEEGEECHQQAICLARFPYSGPAGLGSPASLALFTKEAGGAPRQQPGPTPSATTETVTGTQTTATTTVTPTTTAAGSEGKESLQAASTTTTTTLASPTPSPPRQRPKVRIVRVWLAPRIARLSRHRRNEALKRLSFRVLLTGPSKIEITLIKLGRRRLRSSRLFLRRTVRASRRFEIQVAATRSGRLPAGRYRLVISLPDKERRALDFRLG